jgi:hypothetical protein
MSYPEENRQIGIDFAATKISPQITQIYTDYKKTKKSV